MNDIQIYLTDGNYDGAITMSSTASQIAAIPTGAKSKSPTP